MATNTIYENDNLCCGCGACEAVCPKQIIQMQLNKEGYFYPTITNQDLCVHCDKCRKVCPMRHQSIRREQIDQYVIAIVTNDDLLWNNSASGGAFGEICNCFKGHNPVVFGARWQKLNVTMDYVFGVENIDPFHKSKYVAANPNGILRKVKKYLDEGREVIFSGTPCQCYGLHSFLGKEYNNLLTIDFACHGQGSVIVFNKWIEFIQNKYKRKVKSFSFRTKKFISDHVNSNCCTIIFEDGSSVLETRDYYHHAYVKGLCMRKSCGDCLFSVNRASDITLADFKKLSKGLPQYQGNKNVSTAIANTPKGQDALNHLSNVLVFHPDPVFVFKENPKLCSSRPLNRERDSFMTSVLNDDDVIENTIKKYARITPLEWIEYNCSERAYNAVSYICKLLRAMKKKAGL